jgi:hypothetical protein
VPPGLLAGAPDSSAGAAAPLAGALFCHHQAAVETTAKPIAAETQITAFLDMNTHQKKDNSRI